MLFLTTPDPIESLIQRRFFPSDNESTFYDTHHGTTVWKSQNILLDFLTEKYAL